MNGGRAVLKIKPAILDELHKRSVYTIRKMCQKRNKKHSHVHITIFRLKSHQETVAMPTRIHVQLNCELFWFFKVFFFVQSTNITFPKHPLAWIATDRMKRRGNQSRGDGHREGSKTGKGWGCSCNTPFEIASRLCNIEKRKQLIFASHRLFCSLTENYPADLRIAPLIYVPA